MNPAFAGLMGAGRVDALRAVSLCIADFDQDGSLDFFDYDAFVGAFELGTEAADFNHDGSVDFFDYDHFVGTFESGC